MTVHELISAATRRLANAGIDNARLDAEVLLMHLMHVDRAHLYLAFRDPVSPDIATNLSSLIDRRLTGEPVAYLTGHREFMGFDFLVDTRVLIPRPETEGLVELAMRWLVAHADARRVVDVGTGSGAIAICIDELIPPERPILIFGTDISRDALDVARTNAKRLHAERVRLVNGSLLEWCHEPVELVVANLPYLREEQRHGGIEMEPDLALYADEAGFALYLDLILHVARCLSPGGALMCEIDPSQTAVAMATARESFPDADVRVEPDLSGRDRYLIVDTTP